MKYKMNAAALILIVILTFIPFGLPTAFAQPISRPAVETWNLVKAVAPGESLEIRLKNGDTVNGNLKSVTETDLTLLRRGSDINLRRDDISRVYQTVRKSSQKPVLVGAAAGALIGVGIGAAVHEKKAVKTGATFLLVAGVTSTIGALVGWGLGRGKSKVLIYEAR